MFVPLRFPLPVHPPERRRTCPSRRCPPIYLVFFLLICPFGLLPLARNCPFLDAFAHSWLRGSSPPAPLFPCHYQHHPIEVFPPSFLLCFVIGFTPGPLLASRSEGFVPIYVAGVPRASSKPTTGLVLLSRRHHCCRCLPSSSPGQVDG